MLSPSSGAGSLSSKCALAAERKSSPAAKRERNEAMVCEVLRVGMMGLAYVRVGLGYCVRTGKRESSIWPKERKRERERERGEREIGSIAATDAWAYPFYVLIAIRKAPISSYGLGTSCLTNGKQVERCSTVPTYGVPWGEMSDFIHR